MANYGRTRRASASPRLRLPSQNDITASLVVFVIAIPLSLGIALASGAPASAGLLTAIVGGVVAGALAGAPLAVTGPAAGLTALVFQLVQQHGLEALGVITVICGAFQIFMALAKAGRLFTLIPKSVLEGVLSAIGLIIVLGQLHVLAGAAVPKDPVLALTQLWRTYSQALGGAWLLAPALICGLFAMAVQLLWPKLPRRISWLPAALPAVVIVTAISLMWDMPRVELMPLLPAVQEGTERFLSMGWLSRLPEYLFPALGLAVVASAESLLTARAVDVLITDRPGFKPAELNRELLAQGFGNTISGVLGGLPMTAVMVRSAANVNAGGESRWSTILHGAWIFVFVAGLPFILTKIPLTALAAVLILTGWRLINFKHCLHTLRVDRFEGCMWVFTTAVIFATDLLQGLITALVVYALLRSRAIVHHIKKNSTFTVALRRE